MPRYSEERKAAVLKKLLPPHNRSVVSVAAEEGISDVTLCSWLKQCRQQGMPVPGNRNTGEDWSPEAKLAVVSGNGFYIRSRTQCLLPWKRPVSRASAALEKKFACKALACRKTGRKSLRSNKGTPGKPSRS